MPAIGRDVNRDAVGGGGVIALVGMGMMQHLRVVFDHPHRRIHVLPGPGYFALARAGLVLEDARPGAGVARVAPGSAASNVRLDLRDIVVSVDGQETPDAHAAADAIMRHAGAAAVVRVRRGSRQRRITLALEPAFEDCFPGDPYCPAVVGARR